MRSFRELPGPRNWPLLGTLPDFIRKGGLSTRYKQDVENYFLYGPLHKINLDEPTVIICDPRDWYLVFKNEGRNPMGAAGKAWPFVEYSEMRDFKKHSFSTDGEEWRTYRSCVQKYFFSHADARAYVDLIAPVVEDFSRMAPVHQDQLKPLISVTAFEMIAVVCYGKRVPVIGSDLQNGDQAEFARLVCNMFEFSGRLMFSGNPLHRLKLSKDWKEFVDSQDRIMQYVNNLTKELEEIVESGRDRNPEEFDKVSKSYLGKHLLDPKSTAFRTSLSASVISLMLAGVDTTTHMFSWLLLHLARNQEVQNKLAGELKASLNGESLSTASLEKQEFRYFKNCLKECMRLTPTAGGTQRTLPVDINIRGYHIPKGTMLGYSPVGLHVDPKYFEDPLEFIPERWSAERIKARESGDPDIHSVVDHPMIAPEFSFGPRMCMGARIAQNEITSLIARLVQDYKVELAEPETKVEVKSSIFHSPSPFPKYKFIKRT
eukprot:TRINITY_DN9961_c0_g1_i1.p1 TRINITY_DN9961_c0_g1~~TRINITY_DN9961_c0_g1_i1.p1  ORF type:complete len:488 (-),score=97.33 TRINITY_DN9961_c0_g1_i1:419-1882(-)